MAKNKNKKQNKPQDVYMQITDPKNDEKYMLKVPANYKNVLDSLMSCDESEDYHNSHEILQFFCEIYTGFDNTKRKEFEVLLNSKVAKTEGVADMLTLALQMHKYYRLVGVDTKEKLGRFHILASRRNNLDDWISKCSFEDAAEVGKKIKQAENGKFYKGDYVGVYHCFLEEQAED